MLQLKLHMVTIEDLVPGDHFLRRLDAALDLSFVYEETKGLYSKKYGRPPIDPVVLVKYLLVGFLYGIPSERQIEQRIQTDVALRWYLELDLFDRVPDHSTISQLRRRKPSFRKVFRRLFEEVIRQCVEKGLASGRLVGTDSTHVKANASRSSEYLVELEEEAGLYWDRLDEYEEKAAEELARRTGKKHRKRVKQIKKDRRRSHRRVSRTDPEAGYMDRPGKPKGMHYLEHELVDLEHGIILDVVATPGNSNDLAPYLEQLERVHREIFPVQAAVADSAYDAPLVHGELGRLGIRFYTSPKKVVSDGKAVITRDQFSYDKEQDVYHCPAQKELRLARIRRSSTGLSWCYAAAKSDCQSCPLREQCLSESVRNRGKVLERNYFAGIVEQDFARLETAEYQEALRKRQIFCEGNFAAQKRGHNLTRLLRRGLGAAEDHGLLSATALNLKKLIKYEI